MVFVQDIAMNRVLDALVSKLTALQATSLAGVVISDGVMVPSVSERIIIGLDGDPDSTARPTLSQRPASLAFDSRYEDGVIPCAVIVQSGATDPIVIRDRLTTIFGVITAALYADRQISSTVMTSSVSGGSEGQYQNSQGSAVVLSFEIAYMAQV